MKLYIDRKKVKVLKRSFKSVVLRAINQFQYSSPAPKGVSNIADLKEDSTIHILWEGERPPQQFFDHYHPPSFLQLTNIVFKKPFVAKLKHGRVYGERGYVITDSGYILTDVNPEMSQSRNRHSLSERGPMPKPEKISGSVALLNSAGYNNYFHYLFDILGRLQYLDQVDTPVDYYYTPYNTSFQKELLELFGIPKTKIIKAEKNRHIVADQLFVTSVPGDSTLAEERYKPYKDLSTYQYVSKRILSKLSIDNSVTSSPLLYIQRRGNRAVENEDQLLEKLGSIGKWNVFRLEEHSVTEQAYLFHNAKVIVALHGAGLANLIFCKPQTTVLEITNPAYPSPLYYQISSLFNLNYYPFVGVVKDGLVSKKNDIKGNVKVDVEPILRRVRKVLSADQSEKSITSYTGSDE